MSIKESLNRLRNAIADIDRYKPIWESIYDSGEDFLGEFTIGSVPDSSNNRYMPENAYRLVHSCSILYTPIPANVHYKSNLPYYDLSNRGEIKEAYMAYTRLPGNHSDKTILAFNPGRIIFPEKFTGCAGMLLFENGGAQGLVWGLCGGLYLPRIMNNSVSRWIIGNAVTLVGQNVPNGVNVSAYDSCESNIYLESVNVSAESLEHLIRYKLKDFSNTTETRLFSVGTSNLDKISANVKNIAYAKGWELQ
jgi:hypothetical protein